MPRPAPASVCGAGGGGGLQDVGEPRGARLLPPALALQPCPPPPPRRAPLRARPPAVQSKFNGVTKCTCPDASESYFYSGQQISSQEGELRKRLHAVAAGAMIQEMSLRQPCIAACLWDGALRVGLASSTKWPCGLGSRAGTACLLQHPLSQNRPWLLARRAPHYRHRPAPPPPPAADLLFLLTQFSGCSAAVGNYSALAQYNITTACQTTAANNTCAQGCRDLLTYVRLARRTALRCAHGVLHAPCLQHCAAVCRQSSAGRFC